MKSKKQFIIILLCLLCVFCLWIFAYISMATTRLHRDRSTKASHAVESLFPVIELYDVKAFSFDSFNECVLINYDNHRWMSSVCAKHWEQDGYRVVPADQAEAFRALTDELRHPLFAISTMPVEIQYDGNGQVSHAVFIVSGSGFYGYQLIYNESDDLNYTPCSDSKRTIRENWDYYICSPL